MKGYARVSKETLKRALDIRNAKKDKAVEIRERAISDIAEEIRLYMNFVTKFFKRNKTEYQLVFGNSPWDFRYRKLINYVSMEEFKLIQWFYTEDSYEQGAAIRNLIETCEEDYVLLDDELCEFIKLNKELPYAIL